MSCGVSEGVILCNESMRGCVMSCRVVLCRTVHSQGRGAKQGWVRVRVRIKSVS